MKGLHCALLPGFHACIITVPTREIFVLYNKCTREISSLYKYGGLLYLSVKLKIIMLKRFKLSTAFFTKIEIFLQ